MGTAKQEDLIAWQDGNKVIRADCGDPDEIKPLTRGDLNEGGIVTCGQCKERGSYKPTGRGLYMPCGLLRSVLESTRIDGKGQRHR